MALSCALCLQVVPGAAAAFAQEAAESEPGAQVVIEMEEDAAEPEFGAPIILEMEAADAPVPPPEPGQEQPDAAKAAGGAPIQITGIAQLEPYFPDPLFRQAVFDAVKNGADKAEGADVIEALNNFRGEVKYNNSNATPSEKKIKDVHGIEYLRNASLVSLKYNEIKDLVWLGREKNDTGGQYYGQLLVADTDIAADDRNVVWDFSGNPMEKLPQYFGGRLKILQPGGASYTYPEDVSEKLVYLRPLGKTAVDGVLGINVASIYENSGALAQAAGVVECRVGARPGDITTKMVITSHTDTTANFSNLEKSGAFHIYIGLKAELKYSTNDEYAGITDGAQSAKYYITPTFRVYDRITAASLKGGRAELIKTDSETKKPLAGAEYSLYKKDGTLVSAGMVTDKSGKLTTTGLLPGEYYFSETKAPDGYRLSGDKQAFTIAGTPTDTLPDTQVGGGEASITTTDGQTVTAAANERLFCGGRDGADGGGQPLSPDITLSSADSTAVILVKITYAKHDGEGENVVRTFQTLEEAQADINAEKNNNTILGPVSVEAYYADPSGPEVKIGADNTPLPKTQIEIEKVWVDNEDFTGVHPDVTLRLYNGATEVASCVLKAPAVSCLFQNLPAEDGGGSKITYMVKEDPVPGYTSAVNGLVVTNTFENTETIAISGTKHWEDHDNAFQTRPGHITVALLADGVEIKTAEAEAASGWAYRFEALPKYTEAGKKITYAVREKDIPQGYAATVNGSDITNTFTEPTAENTSLTGRKFWLDNNNAQGTRPAVLTVELYQDGVLYRTQEIAEKEGWAYSFTGLPRYSADGKAYRYTVQEAEVPQGYTAKAEGNDITNTLVLPVSPPPDTPQAPGTGGPVKISETPQTGDPMRLRPLAVLMAVSLGVLAVGSRKSRKAPEEK